MFRDTSSETSRHPGLATLPAAPVRSALSGRHVAHTLRDGTPVRLRPLEPGEGWVLEHVFAGMSDHSRRQRFLVPMPRLPGAARRALSDVDGVDRVAWVALDGDLPVGLARWSRTGRSRAEIAFEVVDSHQRRGIGSALVDAVATLAADRGIHELEATVEPDNHPSVRLLCRLGIRLRPVEGLLEGRGLLHLTELGGVDRRAVLAVAAQAGARTGSSAAATSSSRRSAP